ncbi:DUF6957 family protein [Stutzerimonas chloritidismutans]|uniref:DUF6957 family protein n=1 Tax=Stutzerimonas chloritidismutans TaxID=203192 RepID=UPI003F18D30D
MDQLNTVHALLYGPGAPMLGHEATEVEIIARVRELFPGLSYCLVRHWIWIDLDISDAAREELKKAQRQPVMLYAHEVVFDSLGRFNKGDWVRSTPLLRFTEGGFFQTQNTVYVLLGHGKRERAEPSTVASIY